MNAGIACEVEKPWASKPKLNWETVIKSTVNVRRVLKFSLRARWVKIAMASVLGRETRTML